MAAKKKILFIVNSLAGGGAEKALIELLKNFDYDKYDVELCMVFNTGVYIPDIPSQVKTFYLYEVEDHGLHGHSIRRYRKQGWEFPFRWRVRSKIKGHYDAIISFIEGDAVLFHSMVTDRADRNITWLHCNLETFHWTRRLFRSDRDEKRAYAKMDTVVACSQCALDSFRHLYNLPLSGHVIPNIVDADNIRELARLKTESAKNRAESSGESHPFTVVSVGSLSEVKCFDRLIRAAARLRDEGYDLRFRIAGEGKCRPALEALRDRLHLGDSFELLGFVKPPYPVVKDADLFVSTSQSEAAPLVFCEAMALNVPVVATRNEGSDEILDGGNFGLLVEQDDEAIYQGIKRMIDDADLRQSYIAKGNERVKMFSKENALEKLSSLLES